MTILSLLALGISSLSMNEKSTPAFWYVWWVLGGVLAPIARNTQPWLRHLSFNYNLDQIALRIFRPAADLKTAQDNIPVLGDLLRNIRPESIAAFSNPAWTGALIALALMIATAAFLLAKRVKPE
jgi:hypothetical protein